MDKLFLLCSIISVAGCYVFFFFSIDLVYGSISFILSIVFAILYAMQSTTNKLSDDQEAKQ